ncbi:PA14 domain-containing protein [Flavobacterium restrictum]|uniref:T9SS sorting signal type C domain-containing protein n=1 Tax=Flavobacterium restrictum TaxID=2594428 RepID=A0A553E6N8_9FLAO|nr:PA14 domain-containing protein [Flavobacterium restrictum]TRX40503.1 T9SS sorting signal type C domain-containing protein [Flavobacterium restrictum]
MKKYIFLLFLLPLLSFGQSIWTNPLTLPNTSVPASPYNTGNVLNSHITVSGITRSAGITGDLATDRYSAVGWATSASIDPTDYYEFTLTPNAGYKIDFTSFVYTGQASTQGPTVFAIRSSADTFTANVGAPTATGTTISLAGNTYQNVTSAITFRIYGWAATIGTGTFSINDFTFNGAVSCGSSFLTTPAGSYSYCIDNSNTITTATVNEGQYVVLNVVKGFTYTFAVGNAFGGNENLTVINDTDATNTPLVSASGASGATISLWQAPFSGKVKIRLASDACTTGTTGLALTLTLNSLGNTQDSQTVQGANSWVGHVYNYPAAGSPGGASPATPPTNVTPFLSANYVGYYNEAESFYQEFSAVAGTPTANYCFPVLTNGINLTNIDTQGFAVRYQMKSTKAAGCYVITFKSDDGIRLYVDNALKYDNWTDHGLATGYAMIYLTGNSDLIYDYYENGGSSQVGYGISSLASLNTVVQPTSTVCASASLTLDGSSFTTYGFAAGVISYQWQSSPDNATWTSISGATTEDYTIVSGTIAKYYKRIVTSSANAGCSNDSNVVSFVISPVSIAGTVSANQTICNGTQPADITLTGNTGTIQWQSSPNNATWTNITGATTSPLASAQMGSLSATQYYRAVVTSGVCAVANSTAVTVTVNAVVTAGAIAASQTICNGATPAALTSSTNGTGSGIITYEWQTNASGSYVTVLSATSATYAPPALTTTTSYQRRTVSVSGGTTCYSSYTTAVTITVNAAVTAGTIGTAQTICSSATPAALTSVTNGSGSGTITYEWQTNASGSFVTISGATSATYAPPALTATTSYQRRTVSVNGITCYSGYTTPITITISSAIATNTIATAQTICSGTTPAALTGSTPTGGSGTYAYLWESSTTSASAGFGNASGTNSNIGYSPASLSATTWYRRTVTSGGCSNTSTVIEITVTPLTATPTIGTITQPDCTTATGSVVLNGLPSGSWVLTRSPGSVVTTGTGTSTTITSLASGTYTYSVIGTNNGTGLKAEYFNNMTLTGTPVLTRTDATINNDWVNGSPDPLVNADNFSVRWSGQVQPLYSETYTFTTRSDDGIRLWVNGTQVINNWTDHSVATNTGTIALVAGVKYAIVLEYYENAGQAVAQLSWNSTSQALQIIPQSQMYPAAPCSSAASANVDINPQPSTPSTPIVAAPTQPSCTTPTGSVVLSSLPTTGTWTLYQNGTSIYTTTGGSGTYTVTGLSAAGSPYVFKVSNASCTSSNSTSIGITGLTTTTWSGTAWSSGTPTLNTLAILNGNYDTATYPDINACTLTINGGFTLTIQNQKFVTIQNDLTVNTGSVVEIKNQGSLVMINDAGVLTTVGTGKFNVNKTTTSFEKYDYTYWATPLAGTTTIATVFPTWRLDRAYEFHPENFIDLINVLTGQPIPDGFDDNENDWLYTSSMSPGRGYIIMGPTSGSFPRTESVVFTGKVNTGVITTPIQLTPDTTDPEDDFNLVGNPYPCAISADALINANITGTGTLNKTIDGTLWFWTHKADIAIASNGLQSYNYSQDDYAVYTLAGGTGTSASASGGAKPLGYIASGQGFFVEATAAGTLTFNNSMRVSPAITASPVTPATANAQFYKTMPIKPKAADKNRIWLNLENELGMFSQQLVAYFDNTTLRRDNGYDGLLSDAGNYINFYSIENNDAFKIQARPTFTQDDEVPLGYFSAVAGTFNINIDSKEGVFNDGANVYLEDKLVEVIHDLKAAPYTFTTEEGTFDDRFVLRYTNKSLGTGDFDALKNTVLVAVKSKKITINSFAETLDKVAIYDVLGKQLYKKSMLNANELSILNLPSSEQTLLVKVTLQSGQTVTKKVIY